MNLSASKVHHAGLVQGLCRAFIMAFVYVVPLFELMAHPVCGRLCLFGSGLWHCSIAPCSPQGKSSLHCPTLQALSVTGEGWIGDQKNLFPPRCQVIFTLGPCAAAQCHTPIIRGRLLSICGTWAAAFVPLLKPNHLVHMVSRLSKNKRVRLLKSKWKRFLLKNNEVEINP